MTRNPLRSALRFCIDSSRIAAVRLTFVSVAPSFAQSAPEASQELEAVTVTGSRIRKAEFESAEPIVVIARAAIEKQGVDTFLGSSFVRRHNERSRRLHGKH